MTSTDELVDQALEEGILEESQEMFRLIAEVTASQGQAAERVYERYKHIVSRVQPGWRSYEPHVDVYVVGFGMVS